MLAGVLCTPVTLDISRINPTVNIKGLIQFTAKVARFLIVNYITYMIIYIYTLIYDYFHCGRNSPNSQGLLIRDGHKSTSVSTSQTRWDTLNVHRHHILFISLYVSIVSCLNMLTVNHAWWLIPLSKWVITPVINGISRVNPLITGDITHLLSGMSHQVYHVKSPFD